MNSSLYNSSNQNNINNSLNNSQLRNTFYNKTPNNNVKNKARIEPMVSNSNPRNISNLNNMPYDRSQIQKYGNQTPILNNSNNNINNEMGFTSSNFQRNTR